MSASNTGGPAFPCHTNPLPGKLANAPQGMSVRQYYKAAALPGVFNIATETCRAGGASMGKEEIANRCGIIADAMLEEDEEHAKK